MLALAFTFPAGRYHATPWGRHVNEADVGWPPDLWRLARALIATWHRKLDPNAFPRERLAKLLANLAGEAPHYKLPEAVHFHTRHYMPSREGAKEKSTLIFDAFAHVGRDAELIAYWPQTALDAAQTELLDALLKAIGYLGRAESWVEARRLEKWDDEPNCRPSEQAVDPATGEIGDLVPLWLPCSPEQYAAFRTRTLEDTRKQKLSKRELKQIEATLPEDWLQAISLDTGPLQAAGWSAPPAARQAYYWRPKEALRFMAAAPARARPQPIEAITAARYALYARPLPRITDAVRVGETLRIALMGRARRLFGETIPACLSGHGPKDPRHGHAFFLPEPSPNGYITHLLVYAPAGFDAQAQAALRQLKTIHIQEGADWHLMLEGLGQAGEFTASTLVGKAAVWRSVTPYLHPWHNKKRFGIAQQIARECRLRGYPEPIAVELLPDAKPRALEFRRFRSKRGLTQPDRLGCFVKLTFPEPLPGPLALGFGCHFGLGLFAPA